MRDEWGIALITHYCRTKTLLEDYAYCVIFICTTPDATSNAKG